jgi:DSF synthase
MPETTMQRHISAREPKSRPSVPTCSCVGVAGLHRHHRRAARWTNVQHRINYAVVASKVDGIFNLGGDLSLFREAIAKNDRDLLVGYGRKCVDNLYPWSRNCDLPLTTIALVQGEALGGGFECALSASVLVAEESSRMGFPEILFNLFPGMGAYSFLSRKVGRRSAES